MAFYNELKVPNSTFKDLCKALKNQHDLDKHLFIDSSGQKVIVLGSVGIINEDNHRDENNRSERSKD
jgi:hypothetical protein